MEWGEGKVKVAERKLIDRTGAWRSFSYPKQWGQEIFWGVILVLAGAGQSLPRERPQTTVPAG